MFGIGPAHNGGSTGRQSQVRRLEAGCTVHWISKLRHWELQSRLPGGYENHANLLHQVRKQILEMVQHKLLSRDLKILRRECRDGSCTSSQRRPRPGDQHPSQATAWKGYP
jgi:hypothetical protein